MKMKLCLRVLVNATVFSALPFWAYGADSDFKSNPFGGPRFGGEAPVKIYAGDDVVDVREHTQDLYGSIGWNVTTKLGPTSKAQAELAAAKTEEEKQSAKKKLREALAADFDVDVERRQADLERIRQQLSKLEGVLQKRIQNKEKVVDLRLQVLTAEVEGLGWGTSKRRLSKPTAATEVSTPPSFPQPPLELEK